MITTSRNSGRARTCRKYVLGRPTANSKIGASRIHLCEPGVETGSSVRSICTSAILPGLWILYNASNNELVRTKTLLRNAIIVIDVAPLRVPFAVFLHADQLAQHHVHLDLHAVLVGLIILFQCGRKRSIWISSSF
ncbi:ribosomal protein S8 [Culex quinquefasciatus]|uniref:Ribosomal protein S8 n=1 Tax=Culex quinquefasciatus TaxID=7176 RepID=B0X2X3_CULQU|nr:ribosomal protein S8 [Culex quinquefasciatus]|eukprot:XP_001863995.1 ribosomal protein S8 [Culex quinquefasciatus]